MTEQSEDLQPVDEIEDSQEIQEESNQEEQTEEKKISKSQNAKQRLRRKLREEAAARAESEERARKLEEKLNEFEQKLEKVANPAPARPSRQDYETEEDYEDALFDWRDVTKSTPAKEPEKKKVEAKSNLPQVDPKVLDNWESQTEQVSDKYDDFEDVLVSIPHDSMTEAMTLAIMESEQGGEVAYFLGHNHVEADRIARLSIAAQVREIDKLAVKLKPNKQTKAPTPITPEKGGDSPGKDPAKMSPEEYRDWRRANGMGR